MPQPDLNLLYALDVLLTEQSVARAAKRLQLSPSAMSRTLARLRETIGDPLLVRAGRGLVPTPHALQLRGQIGPLLQNAQTALRAQKALDLKRIERTFTLKSSEGFVETFGPALLAEIANSAPGLKLRFLPKSDRQGEALRDGSADLETGIIGDDTSPEIRTMTLFRDGFVGVVRQGHPLSSKKVTLARFAKGQHIRIWRDGRDESRLDKELDTILGPLGLERTAFVAVGGFASAIALARNTDLIASVPERHTEGLRDGTHSFALPVETSQITISLLWHPRMDADPAHRWLRGRLREICMVQPGAR